MIALKRMADPVRQFFSGRRQQRFRLAGSKSRIRQFRKMIQIKARTGASVDHEKMWKLILSAPFGRSLELAVFDEDGEHALVFPCIRGTEGWKNAATGARVDIRPTHWRDWAPERIPASNGDALGDRS